MTTRFLCWAAGFVALLPLPSGAQQILEIDFETGRTIIDDELRSMGSHIMAVDWDRGILYVKDNEEPDGVMAFSLETGEWLRTISTPKGDGPNEFTEGRTGLAIAPDGGLFVSGYRRVVGYDQAGTPMFSWTPVTPASKSVCNLGGVPAVPTQGGVVRRGSDGTDESVGPVRARGRTLDVENAPDARMIGLRLFGTQLACTADRAYVVIPYDNGPDSVFAYHLDGREAMVAIPTEGTDDMKGCVQAVRTGEGRTVQQDAACPIWSQRLYPSFDDLGNLVLFGTDKRIHGAIINPETGCYAVVRATTNRYLPVRVRADSVMVFRGEVTQVQFQGRTLEAVNSNSANGVSMHPLRRVSGEPCPGMLPSVR